MKLRLGETKEFIEIIQRRLSYIENFKGDNFNKEKIILIGLYIDVTSDNSITGIEPNSNLDVNSLVSSQMTVI